MLTLKPDAARHLRAGRERVFEQELATGKRGPERLIELANPREAGPDPRVAMQHDLGIVESEIALEVARVPVRNRSTKSSDVVVERIAHRLSR